MAGLVCYYNTENFYYLKVSRDEELGKYLGIISCDRGNFDEGISQNISLNDRIRIYLRVKVDYQELQFYYSLNGIEWKEIGPVMDATILSDDYVTYNGKWGFTGAFMGLCCQDLSGQKKAADFDYFEYLEE